MLTIQWIGLLSGWMITGTLFLLAGWFGVVGQTISFIIPLCVAFWFRPQYTPPRQKIVGAFTPLAFGVIGVLSIAIALLFVSSTTESIRSVWDVLPAWWILLPLLSAILFATTMIREPGGVEYITERLLWFTILSIGVSIFPLGYGFDQHIHEATLQTISTNGALNPLTPYYLGYYGLLLSFHPLLSLIGNSLPLHVLNQWLVPVLAAMIIPSCRRLLEQTITTSSLWQWFAWLLIPWVYFTHTNPQTLGLLWLLITVIFLHTNRPRAAILVSIAGLTLHPISGIAGIIAVVFLIPNDWLNHSMFGRRFLYFRLHAIGQTMLVVGGALLIPLSFFINVFRSSARLGFDFSRALPFVTPQLSPLADPWYGIIYGWIWNRLWWLALLICAGLFVLRTTKTRLSSISEKNSLLGFISIECGALTVYYISGIPDTSSADMALYAQRFAYAGMILVLPILIAILGAAFEHLFRSVRWIRLYGLVILATAIGVGWYTLYPTNDYGYVVSASFNVGLADRHAVDWIQRDSMNQRFIVLANQTVAASAIEQNGFRDYFEISGLNNTQSQRSHVFYYSIPTGGAVYPYYLAFLKHPDRSLIDELEHRTGVHRVYVVMNSYWTESQRSIVAALPIASKATSIDDGRVWVFRFDAPL